MEKPWVTVSTWRGRHPNPLRQPPCTTSLAHTVCITTSPASYNKFYAISATIRKSLPHQGAPLHRYPETITATLVKPAWLSPPTEGGGGGRLSTLPRLWRLSGHGSIPKRREALREECKPFPLLKSKELRRIQRFHGSFSHKGSGIAVVSPTFSNYLYFIFLKTFPFS